MRGPEPPDELVRQYVEQNLLDEDSVETIGAMVEAFKDGWAQGFVEGVSRMEATLIAKAENRKGIQDKKVF